MRHISKDCELMGHVPDFRFVEYEDGRLWVRCKHCAEEGYLDANVVWPEEGF